MSREPLTSYTIALGELWLHWNGTDRTDDFDERIIFDTEDDARRYLQITHDCSDVFRITDIPPKPNIYQTTTTITKLS